MKRYLVILFVIVLLALAVAIPAAARNAHNPVADLSAAEAPALYAQPAAPVPPEARPFLVRGRAVDAAGRPLAGVRVEAYLPGERIAGTAQTASNGSYVIANLEPAAYRLRIVDAQGRRLPLAETSAAAVRENEAQRPAFHQLSVRASADQPALDGRMPSAPPEFRPGEKPPALPEPSGIQATGLRQASSPATHPAMSANWRAATARCLAGLRR